MTNEVPTSELLSLITMMGQELELKVNSAEPINRATLQIVSSAPTITTIAASTCSEKFKRSQKLTKLAEELQLKLCSLKPVSEKAFEDELNSHSMEMC